MNTVDVSSTSILSLKVDSSGYWLYIEGKSGKNASIFLGTKHGPLVETVLNEVYELQEKNNARIH